MNKIGAIEVADTCASAQEILGAAKCCALAIV